MALPLPFSPFFAAAAAAAGVVVTKEKLFSGQRRKMAAMARTVRAMARRKGPMSPQRSQATWARTPATTATQPLPKAARPKVEASHSSGKPRRRCSLTIQLSKAVKSSDVDTPPSTRPAISTVTSFTCSIKLIATSSTQNHRHALRRPYLSTSVPANVPKKSAEVKPVKNSVLTDCPYAEYNVYMFVPCSQSASMIIRYTTR
mmetsp:Transcript_16889/g.51225  ORF Transcript_16889/g.51225 Transcript_16889/m.51225 type:complete len:202 (-) Transcript_16889:250-855(-)